MSCILSHPISGQILVLESGRPALLYTALNNLNIDLTAEIRIVLKSYSNLYLLENTDNSKNVYPTGIGFVQGSGLPNGLNLHNYNTITGVINSTGLWNIATNYFYPNVATPVTKRFQILVKPTGGGLNSYPLPNFETVFTGNGQPVFPISGNNGLEIPVENNGQINFVESGIIEQPVPFVESEGPTLEEGDVPQEPPPPPPVAGGDPVNLIPLRVFSNVLTDNQGVIVGFDSINCTWAASRYVDTRTRAENLFLGRIGNRYTRVDTQTTSGWSPGVMGIIVGVKFSQGILSPNGQNGFYPFGVETGSTLYFLNTGRLPNGRVATSLIRKDLNGPYMDIINNGTGIMIGNELPTASRLSGVIPFSIVTDIGINDATALRFRWVNNATWRNINEADLGGVCSYSLGDLHSFDQVGGSLIEHLNYTYDLVPYNHPTSPTTPTTFFDFINLQTGNWAEWGKTLKWTELTSKAKHFYGINWLISKAWTLSGITELNNSSIMSGLYKWRRSDPGFENSQILIARNIAWARPCLPPAILLGGCLDCDPACGNFTGDFTAANSSPMGCGNGSPMTQGVANCYGVPWSSTPCPSSSSSGPGTNNFIDYTEFENLLN
jgi:hypothetical protein